MTISRAITPFWSVPTESSRSKTLRTSFASSFASIPSSKLFFSLLSPKLFFSLLSTLFVHSACRFQPFLFFILVDYSREMIPNPSMCLVLNQVILSTKDYLRPRYCFPSTLCWLHTFNAHFDSFELPVLLNFLRLPFFAFGYIYCKFYAFDALYGLALLRAHPGSHPVSFAVAAMASLRFLHVLSSRTSWTVEHSRVFSFTGLV